jgi:hypothetical protein
LVISTLPERSTAPSTVKIRAEFGRTTIFVALLYGNVTAGPANRENCDRQMT